MKPKRDKLIKNGKELFETKTEKGLNAFVKTNL